MWQKKIFVSAVILLVALMGAFPAASTLARESNINTINLSTMESSVPEAYAKLPLLITENQGQVDEAVRYCVKTSGKVVYFTEKNIGSDLICSDLAGVDDTADFQETALVQYDISINSTEFGSVTMPGEGIFNYTAGTVVELEATPDTGYRFDRWTGDVGTIADVNDAATNITIENNYSITANFVGVEVGNVGIKAGDWIKLKYAFSGWPAGQAYPEWLRLEFLTVQGTIATVRFTQHISDGTEQSDNATINVVSNIEVPMLAGIVISANLTTGDSVYIAGHGNVSIEDEATKAYAGADRTVVYASFAQNETQVTYYWDKLTGVMVELSSIYTGFTATVKATETNMWETTTVRMPWWPWIIIAVLAVGLVIFFVRRRRAAQTKG
jgi:hypothetical protein